MSTTSRADLARAKAARARRRRTLGVDAIVDVALRIVDVEGTEAVSMRRVAAEFDTGPASLYAHVRDKEELLRLVLDRILEEVEVPPSGPWQDVVRTWAGNARAVFLRHQDAARLSFAHVPSGQRMLEVTERLLGAMLEAGVPRQVAAWALDTLSLYVGADAFEGWLYGNRFDDGSGRPPEEVGQGFFGDLADYFAHLPPEKYPHLRASVPAMMEGGGDVRFDFGVTMFLAGIAAQIPPSEEPPR